MDVHTFEIFLKSAYLFSIQCVRRFFGDLSSNFLRKVDFLPTLSLKSMDTPEIPAISVSNFRVNTR